MRPSRFLRSIVLVAAACGFLLSSLARSQDAKEVDSRTPVPDSDRDHVKERNEWFYRGRIVQGLLSAELGRQAYQSKMGLRKRRAMAQESREQRVCADIGLE